MQSAMSQQYKLFFLFSFHLQNFTLLKADFERAG